jgi:predicted Zn-ribbon and HTH transcriptional regulator
MRCPRCKSQRVQRDYDEAFALARLAGVRKLLCNQCGHVFNRFDPLSKVRRAPTKRDAKFQKRRMNPRYSAHLPTEISLIEGTDKSGTVTYSAPSKGHCESISKFGMGLSLVGSRFSEADLTCIGRLLFVRVRLPETMLEAVVSIVNPRRVGENQNRKYFLGVRIHQISDLDKEKLTAYLQERSSHQPLIVSE